MVHGEGTGPTVPAEVANESARTAVVRTDREVVGSLPGTLRSQVVPPVVARDHGVSVDVPAGGGVRVVRDGVVARVVVDRVEALVVRLVVRVLPEVGCRVDDVPPVLVPPVVVSGTVVVASAALVGSGAAARPTPVLVAARVEAEGSSGVAVSPVPGLVSPVADVGSGSPGAPRLGRGAIGTVTRARDRASRDEPTAGSTERGAGRRAGATVAPRRTGVLRSTG
jgi:hypothetical protein